MSANQHRFELELAGQKIPFATSPENEAKLRAAAALVNEQIDAATSSGNRSLERASLIAALKFAGEVLELRSITHNLENPAIANADIQRLTEKLNAIEAQLDTALDSLSLPGAPRPIVP